MFIHEYTQQPLKNTFKAMLIYRLPSFNLRHIGIIFQEQKLARTTQLLGKNYPCYHASILITDISNDLIMEKIDTQNFVSVAL